MIPHASPKSTKIGTTVKNVWNIHIPDLRGGIELHYRTSEFIRPGDIILVRGSTWIDRAITIITRSAYTHAAGVVMPDEVVDIAPFTKTGCKNLWLFAGQADVYTCDSLTDDQRRKIVEYAVGKVGTRYDYVLVLWQASRYLLNWAWPYSIGKDSLCSTLWADAYRKAGVELCPEIIFPSPGDLANSRLLRKVLSY